MPILKPTLKLCPSGGQPYCVTSKLLNYPADCAVLVFVNKQYRYKLGINQGSLLLSE